eukprot:717126-Pleurochrysis_carterae.AAC.1
MAEALHVRTAASSCSGSTCDEMRKPSAVLIGNVKSVSGARCSDRNRAALSCAWRVRRAMARSDGQEHRER